MCKPRHITTQKTVEYPTPCPSRKCFVELLIVARDYTRQLGDWEELQAVHNEQGIRINQRTATTRLRGEKMGYGLAIDVLLQRAGRAPTVSAETQ
jgi:hypothetical protein